jgi:hypothetical protein
MNSTQRARDRVEAEREIVTRWNTQTTNKLSDRDSEHRKDSPRCRELRRQIQAHRIKRLGWSDFVFHFVMEGLGFGRSLRELDEVRLEELWKIVKGYRKSGKPIEYEYDKQGRYMHSLMKRAGWEERTLRAYLIINFKKTHWNLLNKEERRSVIKKLKECVQEVQK